MRNDMKWLHVQVLSSFVCITITASSQAEALSSAEEKTIQENLIQTAQEPGAVVFTPPTGWALAKADSLPPKRRA
jgi:hypothetical protein